LAGERRIQRFLAAVSRHAPVVSQRHRVRAAIGMGRLDRLGGLAVQVHAFRVREPGHERLAQLVVREAPPIPLHLEDRRGTACEQPLVQVIAGAGADRRQIQLSTEYRRQTQARPVFSRHAFEALADHLTHAARQHALRQRHSRHVVELPGLFGQRSHDFHEEEGVALGFAVQIFRQPLPAGDRAQHGVGQRSHR
jgi:hypothetical protein